jgi:hypothetical protein
MFHQMREGYCLPTHEQIAEASAGVEHSFFHNTTVIPMYNILKRASVREKDVGVGIGSLVCCCRKRGHKHIVKNSVRPNYDDFNEVSTALPCSKARTIDTDAIVFMYAVLLDSWLLETDVA